MSRLPGELMMWVLILSELAVFGAGLLALRGVWLSDPEGFRSAQAQLGSAGAAVNTVVLVTSGWLAALAVQATATRRIRAFLLGAALLGLVFLAIKGADYASLAAQGITFETHPFFLFYYLLTGFHAAHVAAGVVILLLLTLRPVPDGVEAGAQFWHMVDLVWVLLLPAVYLL